MKTKTAKQIAKECRAHAWGLKQEAQKFTALANRLDPPKIQKPREAKSDYVDAGMPFG